MREDTHEAGEVLVTERVAGRLLDMLARTGAPWAVAEELAAIAPEDEELFLAAVTIGARARRVELDDVELADALRGLAESGLAEPAAIEKLLEAPRALALLAKVFYGGRFAVNAWSRIRCRAVYEASRGALAVQLDVESEGQRLFLTEEPPAGMMVNALGILEGVLSVWEAVQKRELPIGTYEVADCRRRARQLKEVVERIERVLDSLAEALRAGG